MELSSKATPQMAKKIKSQCHEKAETIAEPKSGPRIGANEFTVINSAMNLVNSLPINISQAIERHSTTPPAPAKPWKKRNTIKLSILGAKAQHSEVMLKIIKEIASGKRRPSFP